MTTLFLAAFLACTSQGPTSDDDEPAAEAPASPDTTAATATIPPPSLEEALGQPVVVTGRRLRLHEAGVVLDVPVLQARLQPRGDIVVLDDPTTYHVVVDHMRFRLDAQRLASALPDSVPVDKLKLTTDDDAFVIEGDATFLSVPMKVKAVPRATADGRLELVLDKAKVLGIGVLPALNLVEDKIGDTPSMFVVEGDHLYLDPFAADRSPQVEARFTHAEVRDGALVATLGEGSTPEGDGSYLSITGGVLYTNGTLLLDPELVLHPEEGDLLRLSRGFDAQLRAGFAKKGQGRRLDLYLAPPDADAVADADDAQAANARR
jgi:hypothetical protein